MVTPLHPYCPALTQLRRIDKPEKLWVLPAEVQVQRDAF
jgi:hypothetical protein